MDALATHSITTRNDSVSFSFTCFGLLLLLWFSFVFVKKSERIALVCYYMLDLHEIIATGELFYRHTDRQTDQENERVSERTTQSRTHKPPQVHKSLNHIDSVEIVGRLTYHAISHNGHKQYWPIWASKHANKTAIYATYSSGKWASNIPEKWAHFFSA